MKQNDFNIVINKWNYSKELGSFLEQVYYEFINYYGEEFRDLIYDAFLNTKVVSCHNVYDCLNEEGMLEDNKDDYMVKAGDLKRAGGVNQIFPILDYDRETKAYKIVDVKRMVAVTDINLSKDYIKGILIHELGHMIKGYLNGFTIIGDTLIEQNGLIVSIYKLSYENNKVKQTLISERGVGIEEGLNSLMEETIAKKLVNPDYKSHGYGVVRTIAQDFSENYNLTESLRHSQMTKDKESLIQKIDRELLPNAYQELESMLDELYVLNLRMFSEIFEREKMLKTSEEIKEYLTTKYYHLINQINSNKKKEV